MLGRPPLIRAVIGHNAETGEPITTFDRIVNALRAGAYFEQACAFAGIHKDTAYGWLSIAGQIRLRTAGDPDREQLTSHEADCLDFSDAVAEADAQWEVNALLTLERLGRGGIPIEKVVTKRGPATTNPQGERVDGPILETTTTKESSLPHAAVLMWRLERRFPKRYRRPGEQDSERGDTPDGLTLEDRQEGLIGNLETYLAGAAAGAAEATAPAAEPAAKVTKPRRRKRTSPSA